MTAAAKKIATAATASTDVEKKDIKLDPRTEEYAKKIKGELKLDVTSGKGKVSTELYASLLPAHITPEILKDLAEHNTLIAAAGLKALSEVAIPVMKKSELERATFQMPTIGKDNFEFNFDKSRQVPDRDNADGGTKTKFGSGSVAYNMYGAGSRGEVKKVKQQMSQLAQEAFGS